MRLDTSLVTRMDQRMLLAPRMIQSMEILQLAVMALQERIQHELEENPVLDVREEEPEEAENKELEDFNPETTDPQHGDVTDPEQPLDIDSKGDAEKDFERLEAMNDDWSNHFNEEHRVSSNRIDEEGDKKHDAMTNMAARPQSLQDYLNDQVGFLEGSEEELGLIRYLISHLDDRGYLTTPLEEISKGFGEQLPLDRLEDALDRLQHLDPRGVGARDYVECLLLQLTPDLPHRDLVRLLIHNHLEDIQHNRLPVIEKKTGASLAVIHEAIEVLKHLNPKPGAQFASENIPYVVPDVAVERNENGEYEIKLLDDWTPNLYISRRYVEFCRDKGQDQTTREFLKRKIQSAQWLIEAIEQRRNTLAKVTRAIVKHQRKFLDSGPEHIEPLKMQQIADLVGVHVTTVSRAVDDKWVQTPRGIFPLKRFFGGGTQTTNGVDVAWETIKNKLLEIVGNEDKANPYSDEELVEKLSESGYPIARRTVTKYRKMLHIQSSRERKVWTE